MNYNLTPEKESEIRPKISRLYNAADDFMEASYKKDARTYWDFYHGKLPKPSHTSMMPAMDRSVFSLVETCLKDLNTIFTEGEDAVSFAPAHNEDAYSAIAATQVVNEIFLRKQNGKALITDGLKTALVEGSAIFKAYWSDDEIETHSVHEEGLENKDAILAYIVGLRESGVEINDEAVEIVENKEGTFDVSLTYSIPREYTKVELLNIEEFLIEPSVKSLTFNDCSYACHRVLKTKSQLSGYGLSDEELEALNHFESDLSAWTINAARTDYRQNLDDDNGQDTDDLAYQIWVKEHYWKTSELSEDGSVRLYKLLQVGEGRIIKVDEIFNYPFYIWNPIPIPNNPFGVSYASTVIDLQCDRAWSKAALHTYAHQAALPSWQVNMKAISGSDIMNPKPGSVYKVSEANAIAPIPMQPMPPVDSIIALIDQDKQERTGVNPGVAGLATSGIETNRSSEQTVNNFIALATGRVRSMALSIANGGYSELFKAIYNIHKNNSSRPIPVTTAYGVQMIDPASLVDRDGLIVNIALTTAEKQKRMANLMMLTDFMTKVMQLSGPFVQPQQQAWMIQEAGNLLGYKNTFDWSVPLQQYQPPGIDPATQVQIENVQADTMLKQAQANKYIADDHISVEDLQFRQQRAAKEDARLDKELELKAAYNADHFSLENNKLGVTAQIEGLKHQHAQQRQANEDVKTSTQNLKVNADIIQRNQELQQNKGATA